MLVFTSLRRFHAFAAALFFILTLSAASCRAAPPFPDRPPAGIGTPTATPLTLTLWHSQTGPSRDELEALARDFHTAYPDLAINPVYVGNDSELTRQMSAAIALDRAPDLVLAERRGIAELARQDGLLALDPFMADPQTGLSQDDLSDFFPGILDEGSYAAFDDQHLAFPFDEEGFVLFYNSDLLQAAQIDHPPRTWAEFSDDATKLTKDQAYGWAMRADADAFSAMLVSQASGLLNGSEKRALFAAQSGVSAMTLVSQLAKSNAARLQPDRASAFDEFVQGRAAFLLGWMSQLAPLRAAQRRADTSFEIGLANLPQLDPKQPFLLIRGHELAITQVSPERARAAWFFIRWLTASPQTARWARNTDAIPLRASALPFLAGELLTNARFRQIVSALDGVVPRFVPRASPPRIRVIEQLVEDAWTDIAANNADVSGTLDPAARQANQILASHP